MYEKISLPFSNFYIHQNTRLFQLEEVSYTLQPYSCQYEMHAMLPTFAKGKI